MAGKTDVAKQITYLAGALKAPRITEAAARMADQARDAGWSFEDYLAAVLEREVSARNASGAELRIKAAGFPSRKMLEDFDWDAQPATRQQIAALASGGFLLEAQNVVLLGPPGTGKTHLATALGIVAARHGHRVLLATATDWVTRLTDAHRQGNLPREPASPLRADHRRRSRLPPVRTRRRQPLLPAGLVTLRTRVADPDLEPAVLRLGWRLRRPGRRRRDDRPGSFTTPTSSPSKGPATASAAEASTASPAFAPPPTRPRLDCPQPFTFRAPKVTRIHPPPTLRGRGCPLGN